MNKTLWAFRLAFVWFVLFSVNALCTAVIASLTGTQWSTLDNQSKFMIIVAILLNWTGTIMAFISKNAKKIEDGQLPDNSGGTQFITKTDVTTQVTQPKPTV